MKWIKCQRIQKNDVKNYQLIQITECIKEDSAGCKIEIQ
jgi:hypothetical protein